RRSAKSGLRAGRRGRPGSASGRTRSEGPWTRTRPSRPGHESGANPRRRPGRPAGGRSPAAKPARAHSSAVASPPPAAGYNRTAMTVATLIATLLLADPTVAAPPREAVVTVAVENMYGSADDTANVVSQATLGQVVEVLETSGVYARVRTPDAYEG